jgi:predicted RNA-binding protein with PUA-like domain
MRYWLMKSEPDCYSIDDLQKDGTAMWEGCRNFVVRNYLREEMQIGDRAFFYHSNIPPVGIIGTMEVVSEAYPDPTQFEPESEYYDEKSTKEKPRWYVRDVKFLEKFPRTVTLAELKEAPGLEAMAVIKKGQRLSIMEVTEQEWEIVNKLAHQK